MFENYILSYIAMGLSISCEIASNLIGSSIGKNGILHEPFFLVPIGYFLFLLSILFFFITIFKKIKNKFTKKHKLN